MRKKIPRFKSEDEEREFWAAHDSTDYVDWSKARRVQFPKLRPSMKTISLRLPESMLAELRIQANKRDVPYQSLLKVYLADRLSEERSAYSARRHRR
ncbi:MAG TPA: BrnA antitoxin family protein [Thermoanaerobaculia bacterium]|nr:BrnA antitoxin family protein [Thermoanaerobaculia bacterium]